MWEPEDASKVESACAALVEASEALQTVRDAKEALRRRVTPSKGKSSGKGSGKTKTKTKSKNPSDAAKKIADRKKTSTCKDCGELGHWSGDAECGMKQHSRYPREGNITEMEMDHDVETLPVRDVWMATPAAGTEPAIDSGKGVVDTACRCSVAGDRWYRDYRRILASLGLDQFVTETKEKERYRFGNGGILESTIRATCPAVLAGRAYLITFSVVPSERLTLLGRDLLEPWEATLDMKHGVLRIGCGRSPLVDSQAGHFAVDLAPSGWLALKDSSLV